MTQLALTDNIRAVAMHIVVGWFVRVGVVAPTAPVQRAALVDLYIATNGSSWNDRTGWVDHAASSDPCDDNWAGLSCSGAVGSSDRAV
jgi:hypothetical protein